MILRRRLLIDIKGGFEMVERLRDTAETMSQIIARLSDEIRRLTAENRLLRKRLNSVQKGKQNV